MKICFISDRLYGFLDEESDVPVGGAERQQYLLTQELLDRGYDVAAIVGDYGQPTTTSYQGVETIQGCPQDISKPWHIPTAFYDLYSAIDQVDADRYYVRGSPRLFISSILATKIQRKSLVFCVANDTDIEKEYLESKYGSIFTSIYYRSIKKVDAVVAQTNHQKEQLMKNCDQKSTVIPNAYSLPSKEKIKSHSDRDHILWVGRSHPEKKQPAKFLELARSCPQAEFVMISQPSGDPSDHKRIMEQASSIENLQFYDGVDTDAIHDYYRDAVALVNTSKYEGFPNTFLEAWRWETPVISLSFSLDGELEQKDIGLLSGSMDALIDDTATLWKNEERRKALGENSREYMAEKYTLDTAVERYDDIFLNKTNSK